MEPELFSFLVVLSIIWFVVYWVLGGVFFALVAVVRLGRIRKVRFSCLFSLLSLVLGVLVAYIGVGQSKEAVSVCLAQSTSKAEFITSLFGCGFAGIFGMFLLGAVVLTIGGFLIMALSKSKTKPWIVFEHEQQNQTQSSQEETHSSSKFF